MLPHFVIPLYSFACLLIHLFLKSVSLRVASREQAHFGPPDSELACFLVCVCVGAHLGNESAHIGEKKKHVRHGLCCKTEHLYVVLQWKAHCHPFMCPFAHSFFSGMYVSDDHEIRKKSRGRDVPQKITRWFGLARNYSYDA